MWSGEEAHMSDETAKSLAAAEAEAAKQQEIVDVLKQQCLDEVAAAIPDGAEKYAKSIAQAQPERTKELGRDGVDALRGEIASAAALLAEELKQSAKAVKWPESSSGKNDVMSALFNFLWGTRVDQFDKILRDFGYNIDKHAGLNPHSLYDLRKFKELERQFSLLRQKKYAVKVATAVDDQATVDDLWN